MLAGIRPVLTHLSLGNRALTYFDPSVFPHASIVQRLTLRGNALSSFACDLTAYRSLAAIDLSANPQLDLIGVDTLQMVSASLRELCLSEVKCLCTPPSKKSSPEDDDNVQL